MNVLNWVGPEVGIGRCCSISGFVVENLTETGKKIIANGTITTTDYGEHGWDSTRKWKAISEDQINWTIEHESLDKDGNKATFSIEECAATRNCLLSGAPSGYIIWEKKWIIAMLQELLEKGRAALEIPEYNGPNNQYEGECFCGELPNKKNAWEEITEGKFPDNCLLCSCGQGWHFHEKRGWTKVSRKAFELLSKFNGQATRFMIIVDNNNAKLASETGCHYV